MCEDNFTAPLCLIPPPPPPSPKEPKNLQWWIIVLICLGGVGVTCVTALFFWFRLRKTELYMRGIELHQKRSRPPLPGESCAFCWTDISSSTQLWEANPQMMDRSVALHYRVLRTLLKKHSGYESMTEGDGCLCVFHDEGDAIAWALELQRYMLCPPALLSPGADGRFVPGNKARQQQSDWPQELLSHAAAAEECGGEDKSTILFRGLKVRVGIHCGMLHKEEDRAPDDDDAGEADEESRGASAGGSASSMPSSTQTEFGTMASIPAVDEEEEPEEGGPLGSILSSVSSLIGRLHTFFTAGGAGADDPDEAPSASSALHRRRDDAYADVNMRQGRLRYWGAAVELTKRISDLPSGGIILTTGSCISHASLNDIDGAVSWDGDGVHVLSLGAYLLDADLPACELMVVLPTALCERLRRVRPIKSPVLTQLTPSIFDAPGFAEQWERDWRAMLAPELDQDGLALDAAGGRPPPAARQMTAVLPKVAIVFVTLTGKQAVYNASKRLALESTSLFVQCVRDQLSAMSQFGGFPGYECEENDGDFVLCFRTPIAALLFATRLQNALMDVDWPPRLLEIDEFAPMYAPGEQFLEGDGSFQQGLGLLYRGMRCRIGVLYDRPQSVRPHASSGRADYSGTCMNRCARLARMASPGQILCDSSTWAHAARSCGSGAGGSSSHGSFDSDDGPSRSGRSGPIRRLISRRRGIFNSPGESSGRDAGEPAGIGQRQIIAFDERSAVAMGEGGEGAEGVLDSSGETFTLVGVSLGRHKLKGVQDPVHIVQCSDDGLEMRPIPARFTVRAGAASPSEGAATKWRE